jgi:hypothetical protein
VGDEAKKEEGIWVTHDGSAQSILILFILIKEKNEELHLVIKILICLLNKQVRKKILKRKEH